MLTTTKKAEATTWEDRLKLLVDKEMFPRHVHRILVYGPPGTGKSHTSQTILQQLGSPLKITAHPKMRVRDLLGDIGLKDGNTYCVLGGLAQAMHEGRPLVIDEVGDYSPEVETLLLSGLDDRRIASLRLPDGREITARDGFCVIGTTNTDPAKLPERLRDRFDLILCANTPAQGILDGLPPNAAKLLMTQYERKFASVAPYACTEITVRPLQNMHRLHTAGLPQEQAAAWVFGDKLAQDVINCLVSQLTPLEETA